MITVIDTVTPSVLSGLPPSDAFAGYVGGYFDDLATIEKDYPHHYFVSIAVAPNEVAEFMDFERGDLQSETELALWLKRMHTLGIWRPGFYANASTLKWLVPAINQRMPRDSFRVWGALWDGVASVPNGWDGHQYANDVNKNIDLSVFRDDAFPIHASPKVKRIPHTTLRTWRQPVRAEVIFNTESGQWSIKAA